VPDPGAEARLAQLEERWRRDPGSRIFLQLSEELRRSGRLTRAIEVLREGLVLQPNYPSALVALGRNLLEDGDSGEAAEVLERALAQDPTQLVATKLAVEAHLQNGSPAEARARLDLYRLFNDRDDEIVDLDRRLEELERGKSTSAAPATPSAAPATPSAAPARAAASEAEEAPFDWSPSLSTAELHFEPESRPRRSRDERPFGVLSPGAAERHFAAACLQEGIFPVALVAAAVLEAPEVAAVQIEPEPRPELPPPATVAVPERVPEPDAASETVVEASLAEEKVDAVHEAPPAPAPPPWGRRSRMEELEREETAFAAPQFSPREIGAEVERETIEEPFDEVFAASPAPPRLPQVAAGPPASATLGRLYLEQGHLEEAERTFRAVLEQRPDDAVAARGLEEAVRRRAAPADADDDTATGWSDGAAGRPIASLTQRKVEALRSYLRKIRRSVKPDVS